MHRQEKHPNNRQKPYQLTICVPHKDYNLTKILQIINIQSFKQNSQPPGIHKIRPDKAMFLVGFKNLEHSLPGVFPCLLIFL